MGIKAVKRLDRLGHPTGPQIKSRLLSLMKNFKLTSNPASILTSEVAHQGTRRDKNCLQSRIWAFKLISKRQSYNLGQIEFQSDMNSSTIRYKKTSNLVEITYHLLGFLFYVLYIILFHFIICFHGKIQNRMRESLTVKFWRNKTRTLGIVLCEMDFE